MARKKPDGISDDDLKRRIDQAIQQATLAGDGNMASLRDARIEALQYYRMEKPARFNAGSSSFVSSDVYDAVEDMKATIIETFTGNVKPVRFAPENASQVAQRAIETALVDYEINEKCNGYKLISDVAYDGLMARNGIVQVFWEDETQEVPYTVSNLSEDSANAYLSQHAQDLVDYEIEENEDGTITLHIIVEKDTSGVRIECVPAEEFGINSDSEELHNTSFCYRSRRISLSQLRKMGVKASLVDALEESEEYQSQSTNGALASEATEKQERVRDVGVYFPDDSDTAERLIQVFEVYIRTDTDEGPKTFQCLYGCGQLLKRGVVARHPFIAFTPLRVPHRFWGDDFAAKIIPTQKVNTSVMRFILDSGMNTTVPRWLVRSGSLLNPKQLFEARMGGVVDVNGDITQSVVPLPNPSLNPSMFTLLEQMDKQKQERTGSNDLGGAALKDVLSNQNSTDVVQQMATMGQTRTKIICRNMAAFLKELYERVRVLLNENESQTRTVQIAGSWVFTDPTSWEATAHARVEFHIGYGERDKEASELIQFDQYVSAQPDLKPMYGNQQRYNLLCDVMKLKGHYDTDRYLANPATLPPQQPDPAQVAELQLKSREVAVKEQVANTASMKANADAQIKAASTSAKAQTASANGALKQQQQELRIQQFIHQAGMDQAELRLQHEASKVDAVAKPVNTLPK